MANLTATDGMDQIQTFTAHALGASLGRRNRNLIGDRLGYDYMYFPSLAQPLLTQV
jgi:hypothetical protein